MSYDAPRIGGTPYPLLLLGDPVLATPALPVWKPNDIPRGLVSAMERHIKAHRGLGLSAPQVGVSARIIIAHVTPRGAPLGNPTVMINPEISDRGDATWMLEGCLSIPGFQASIRRAAWIQVAYLDTLFERHALRLEGLPAQVVQHEVDHLDGKLITDGLSSAQRKAAFKCVERALKATMAGTV